MFNVSARWIEKKDKFTLFLYCNFLVLLRTTVCSHNINKQNVNIADEILTDYSFLSKYHYAKSKNYLKKTISNSSLNSHVYWDTLYIYRTLSSTNHPCRSLSFFYDYAYAFSKTLTFLAWILSFSNLIVLFSHVVWDSNALQSACRFSIVTSPAEYSPHTSRVQYNSVQYTSRVHSAHI